jgi:hypothetical protein
MASPIVAELVTNCPKTIIVKELLLLWAKLEICKTLQNQFLSFFCPVFTSKFSCDVLNTGQTSD